MNYAGTGNEKTVAATDLNRTHVGLTVSFQPDDGTLVFGRIGAIVRKDTGVTIALEGVDGTRRTADQLHRFPDPKLCTSSRTC